MLKFLPDIQKSLKKIQVCYDEYKSLINKDINKLEFHVNLIKDTRERIGLRHIKSLDIVSKEIDSLMPDNL